MEEEPLVTSGGFPIDLLGKPARKAANGYHVIASCLATGCKCTQVAKHLDYDHVTMGWDGQNSENCS